MGYKVSWIARSGRSAEELISASRRLPTGERTQNPSEGFYLLELQTGAPWVVLVAYGAEYLEDLDAELAQFLSEDGAETLRFWCLDAVMATQLECFKNGSKAWSIEYDCSDEAAPAITGEVPAGTQDLLEGLSSKQLADPEVDFIYELTAELGSRLIGFRHDLTFRKDSSEAFQVLRFENDCREGKPAAPQAPLDQLFRTLVLSGSVHGIPVEKSEDQLMVGTSELGVEVFEDEREELRLTFLKKGRKSQYRGSVASCAEKIHSFCSPGARHRAQSWWKRWI